MGRDPRKGKFREWSPGPGRLGPGASDVTATLASFMVPSYQLPGCRLPPATCYSSLLLVAPSVPKASASQPSLTLALFVSILTSVLVITPSGLCQQVGDSYVHLKVPLMVPGIRGFLFFFLKVYFYVFTNFV